MYNNIINSKTVVGSTRNPGLPGRNSRNPPEILVFLVGLLGFLQEYVGHGKVLDCCDKYYSPASDETCTSFTSEVTLISNYTRFSVL
jgi:hypothetical protein